jgi:hypothetical protein
MFTWLDFSAKFYRDEPFSRKKVFQIKCPICHSWLWVDPQTEEVIKSERGEKKKGSLEELLLKEKKKVEEFDRKFEATAELEKERHKKTEEKFAKALSELEKEE